MTSLSFCFACQGIDNVAPPEAQCGGGPLYPIGSTAVSLHGTMTTKP